MKVTVTKNGPYIVTGRIPLAAMEICNDDEGYCRTWREVERYPLQETYALCRCGHSKNKPFCDVTHAKIHFDGTEAGDHEPFDKTAKIIRGLELTLADSEHLCVHARFCMRAGGIWNLVKHPESQESRDIALEEECNCPSGRLVVKDNESGKTIEAELEKSMTAVMSDRKGLLCNSNNIDCDA